MDWLAGSGEISNENASKCSSLVSRDLIRQKELERALVRWGLESLPRTLYEAFITK